MQNIQSSRPLFGLRQVGQLLGVAAIVSAGSAIVQSAPASAQAAYGSYIGVGPAFELTKGNRDDNGRTVGAVIAGRYKFLKAPVSLRTQAFIGNGVTLVPTVSYDYPLNWQTDVYLGAGVSVPLGSNSVLGNKVGFALQPGIDYALPNSNLVLFGNAVLSIGGYKGGGTPTSLQGGVGIRY